LVVTLQHTATHCNTLQHIATHCNTLQHIATHCNTLQHTATHCNTLQHTARKRNALGWNKDRPQIWGAHAHWLWHRNTLQHTATHCNTLQDSATHRVEIGIGHYFQAHAHIGRERVQSAVNIFGVQLHSYVLPLVRKGDVKRGIHVSKMCYVCRKRPMCQKTYTCPKRPSNVKWEQRLSNETYVYPKGPTYVKRDLRRSKECQKKHTYVARDLQMCKLKAYICQKRPT